ncbi:TRAP transporter small permease [Savagea sp. SN6]|uniref:TRAP transporter small permease n=1 Tax=Savagea serpentis TaxID=2785297 RepID=A0A8J7KDU2_9BACL|nr:TRAP transporter small permease [Savagea serpentis]MBF4500456.1 TRAP transporter small permease [Savagea serpentis]
MLHSIGERIARVSEVIASILFGSVVIVLLTQVLLRVFFDGGIAWADEFARYVVIWAVLIVSNAVVRNDELIAVDFFDHFWPERFVKWRDVIYQVVFLFILALLFWTGWKQAMESVHIKTAGLQISWLIPYLAIPVGMALILLQYLLKILQVFNKKNEVIEDV